MNQSELGLLFESRWFFYTVLFFSVWLMHKSIERWLEQKDRFNSCRVIKEGKSLFTKRLEAMCAVAVIFLAGLVAMSVIPTLLALGINQNIIQVVSMVLFNIEIASFLGAFCYLAYQGHLMKIRQNARFLLLETLFHNNLHTFHFNGKNLQGAMQDLLKAEMIAPYGSSFSDTGIVYQLTEKGRNAYQEYLDGEAENERLILPVSQASSRKQIS